ncbi:uncharacterized protein TNCV_2526241 [Trichonephila clavipes]|nr:uncharacterized protein TNCV_2526241 [Trichonephila clavipes]
MSIKSPFAIQKALIGISGEPKSVKRLRSGDLLIETTSALQTKSFLLAKSFLNSPVTVFPHKSLNSVVVLSLNLTCWALLIQRYLKVSLVRVSLRSGESHKKDSTIIPTKHLILTFHSPTLPQTIKAGYLNCKIRPYIPNPLRCFKCQRFGHSQTVRRGQLTCSRCASVGHASSDCTLEQKCVNCSQPHSADSKLCPKWKIEKEIQTIKTNRNISYIEARKFITPQPSQTYAQVAKSITVNNSSQTDETITKIVCPPLKLLQPLITISKPIMSPSIPEVIKSSTSTQAELVPSTSSVTVASPSQSPPPNSVIDTAPTTSTPSGGSPSLVLWQSRTEWNEVVSDGFSLFGMMTQRTAPWEHWHLERGFELLRTFGLVRWGLGGCGHVEGTGEKLSFASQAAR